MGSADTGSAASSFGVMLLLVAVYAIRITPKEDAALPVSAEPID